MFIDLRIATQPVTMDSGWVITPAVGLGQIVIAHGIIVMSFMSETADEIGGHLLFSLHEADDAVSTDMETVVRDIATYALTQFSEHEGEPLYMYARVRSVVFYSHGPEALKALRGSTINLEYQTPTA